MNETKSTWAEDEQDLIENGTSTDEINLKVQQAQSALLDLKRQQDEIERQKRDLEELSRKQREFDDGRRQIVEKLTRGLVILERQESEIRREAEQLQIIRENFNEHLMQVEGIKPQEWSARDLQAELTRALAIIDQSSAVYSQSRARLEVLRNEPINDSDEEVESFNPEFTSQSRTFIHSLREGFAFTLPLMAFSLVVLLIILARHV